MESDAEVDTALDGIILGTLTRRGVHDLGERVGRFRGLDVAVAAG